MIVVSKHDFGDASSPCPNVEQAKLLLAAFHQAVGVGKNDREQPHYGCTGGKIALKVEPPTILSRSELVAKEMMM